MISQIFNSFVSAITQARVIVFRWGWFMAMIKVFDRPIAFHRCFVRLTGSVNAALLLSQAVYWSNRTNDPEGWFHKSMDEWEEETGLTRHEQDKAREILRGTGFWNEKKKGVPPKVHY